jgi:transcription termination factor NusB
MQITAHLDDSYQARIVTLQQSTHTSLDELIKQAIDLLYEKTALTPKEKNQRLISLVAGTTEGIEDLSENYKTYLYKGWKEKYDID